MSWKDIERDFKQSLYEHDYSESGLLVSEVPELQIEPGICPCCGELLKRTSFGLECFDCFWVAYELSPIIKTPKKKNKKKKLEKEEKQMAD